MSHDPDDLDWPLLTRYLTGDASPAEAAAVERWFEADPRHRALLDELRGVWLATGGETEGWDTDRAVAELRRRALRASERRPFAGRGAAGHRPAPSFTMARSRSWVALAAGVAAVLVGAGVLMPRLTSHRTTAPVAAVSPAVRDLVTQRAQQAEVRLADGSRVILGPASRLTYADDFGRRERTVTLEGEAYFDVVHDAAKPFRVRTARGVAEDIGTAFVVRDRGVAPLQVVVTEGAVVLRPAGAPGLGAARDAGAPQDVGAPRDSVVLTQGQLGRVLADGRLDIVRAVNADAYVAWTRGELVFEDAPLADVAGELSRWYDADVRVADPAVASRRFSGRFTRRSLEQAVKLVAAVADVSVRRTGAGWDFR